MKFWIILIKRGSYGKSEPYWQVNTDSAYPNSRGAKTRCSQITKYGLSGMIVGLDNNGYCEALLKSDNKWLMFVDGDSLLLDEIIEAYEVYTNEV